MESLGIVEKPGHRESLPGTMGLWPVWGRGALSPYCAHELPGGLVEMQLLTKKVCSGARDSVFLRQCQCRWSINCSWSQKFLDGGRRASSGWLWRFQKTGSGGAAGPMASLPLQEKLERVILGSKAAQEHPEEVRGLWQTCGELMFSLEPRLRHLGLGKEVRPSTTRQSGGSELCLTLSRQSCSPLRASVLPPVKWEVGWMECFLRSWSAVCRMGEGEKS